MGGAVELGRNVIREQAEALRALAETLGEAFEQAVERVLRRGRNGPLIVTGLGKSGLIARKTAATLSSTGTPALFLHPVEGVHGDLGLVSRGDLLLAFSKSGATEEVVRFAAHFRRLGGDVLAVCESDESPLNELAEIHLALPRRREAGPLALAPTTSTTMMLALGDALAMALLERRGFREDDFARFHPEGALGRRLLLRAGDLMHGGEQLPVVDGSASFKELLLEATRKHLGMACIRDGSGRLAGVFTDGDLRRLIDRCDRPLSLTAAEAWRQSRRDPDEPPVPTSTVPPSMLAVDCLAIMREGQITSLVVCDPGGKPIGVIRLQDLVKAGIA